MRRVGGEGDESCCPAPCPIRGRCSVTVQPQACDHLENFEIVPCSWKTLRLVASLLPQKANGDSPFQETPSESPRYCWGRRGCGGSFCCVVGISLHFLSAWSKWHVSVSCGLVVGPVPESREQDYSLLSGVHPTGWTGERDSRRRRCPTGYTGLRNKSRALPSSSFCALPAERGRRFNARSSLDWLI